MEPTPHAGPTLAKQRAVNGYAPGNYFCKCVNCGGDFQGDKRAHACPVCAFEQPMQALLQQLAAAEARATEAAAEAGKWKAEAKAHAARCAVLEKADAAPYCEGQCGICDCETAPVAPQVGFGPEDAWIADLLSGTIPVEGQPAAPAPVAPQQQEGGGREC